MCSCIPFLQCAEISNIPFATFIFDICVTEFIVYFDHRARCFFHEHGIFKNKENSFEIQGVMVKCNISTRKLCMNYKEEREIIIKSIMIY